MEALDAAALHNSQKQDLALLIDVFVKRYNYTYQELVDMLDESVCRSSGEKHKYNWTKAAKDLKLNRGTLLKMRRKCGMAETEDK